MGSKWTVLIDVFSVLIVCFKFFFQEFFLNSSVYSVRNCLLVSPFFAKRKKTAIFFRHKVTLESRIISCFNLSGIFFTNKPLLLHICSYVYIERILEETWGLVLRKKAHDKRFWAQYLFWDNIRLYQSMEAFLSAGTVACAVILQPGGWTMWVDGWYLYQGYT
jgi:hypothetical protein